MWEDRVQVAILNKEVRWASLKEKHLNKDLKR